MKTKLTIGMAIIMLVLAGELAAAERPARERIEAQGWTIGFAPADRAVADGIAKKLPDFKKRMAAIAGAKMELNGEGLESRAGELAKKAATAGGLPEREADFQREFQRAAAAVRELDEALNAALFIPAIEVWRTGEVLERMRAGEKLPGFTWDAKENRPTVNFRFNWKISPEDFRVTKTIELPPAIYLRLEKPADSTAVSAVLKDLEGWASVVQQTSGQARPLIVRLSGSVAIGRVFKSVIANEPATTWVREGLSGYVWREVVRKSVSAKAADGYAVLVAQLPVARTGDKPFNLEIWPEQNGEDHAMMARQVFLNIVDADGPEVLAKLLEAFWKLPLEERTSASFRRLYREQTKLGIEARAPRRSLGAVAK